MADRVLGPCTYCSKTLGTLAIPHSILECQYRQSMYCPVCLSYGHAPGDCPNKIAWALRRGDSTEGLVNLELRIEDSEDAIREFLKSYGLKTASRKMENRKLLRNLANSLNPPRLLLFQGNHATPT
jgi:hypothetical protein